MFGKEKISDTEALRIVIRDHMKLSIRYDVIRKQYFVNGKLLDDALEEKAQLTANGLGVSLSGIRFVGTVMRGIGQENQFNPLLELLFSTEYDSSVDHISQLAETMQVRQQAAWNKHFRKWFLAVVKRATSLGKNPAPPMLVLHGEQGVGKSTWIRSLLPLELRDLFLESQIDATDKDHHGLLAKKLLWCCDELESTFNKRDQNALKQFLTWEQVTVRPPYGRNSVVMDAICSFVGSANTDNFLRDISGNRRYMCFTSEKIDYLHQVDISACWAQAYDIVKDIPVVVFTKEELFEIKQLNEAYLEDSSIEELDELVASASPVALSQLRRELFYNEGFDGYPSSAPSKSTFSQQLRLRGFIVKRIGHKNVTSVYARSRTPHEKAVEKQEFDEALKDAKLPTPIKPAKGDKK